MSTSRKRSTSVLTSRADTLAHLLGALGYPILKIQYLRFMRRLSSQLEARGASGRDPLCRLLPQWLTPDSQHSSLRRRQSRTSICESASLHAPAWFSHRQLLDLKAAEATAKLSHLKSGQRFGLCKLNTSLDWAITIEGARRRDEVAERASLADMTDVTTAPKYTRLLRHLRTRLNWTRALCPPPLVSSSARLCSSVAHWRLECAPSYCSEG